MYPQRVGTAPGQRVTQGREVKSSATVSSTELEHTILNARARQW